MWEARPFPGRFGKLKSKSPVCPLLPTRCSTSSVVIICRIAERSISIAPNSVDLQFDFADRNVVKKVVFLLLVKNVCGLQVSYPVVLQQNVYAVLSAIPIE